MRRNIGKFSISMELIESEDNADLFAVFAVFAKMIVLDARADYATRSILYTAISDMFDDVPEGSEPPQYVITAKVTYDDKGDKRYICFAAVKA